MKLNTSSCCLKVGEIKIFLCNPYLILGWLVTNLASDWLNIYSNYKNNNNNNVYNIPWPCHYIQQGYSLAPEQASYLVSKKTICKFHFNNEGKGSIGSHFTAKGVLEMFIHINCGNFYPCNTQIFVKVT